MVVHIGTLGRVTEANLRTVFSSGSGQSPLNNTDLGSAVIFIRPCSKFVECLVCFRLHVLDQALHVHVPLSRWLEFMAQVEQGFSPSALLTLWAR